MVDPLDLLLPVIIEVDPNYIWPTTSLNILTVIINKDNMVTDPTETRFFRRPLYDVVLGHSTTL